MDACNNAITDGVVQLRYFECLFGRIVGVVIGLAGIAFFVMMLVGGFKFMTAGGDPKAHEAARGTLTMAIAGLVLIAMAYIIILIIGNVTGVPLTEFKIFQGN